ncbi:MAG: 3-methyladenine DNA glycosylase [Alphaproteobacteria bacterium]|jgi:3-methyladenine DNA glycosylase Tag|nr:3-methyladenine DNA glycosylase [Alphaproteobacteria bacterium]MBT4083109.1 3-methyladenine DNA glycosylase [Alphaproteobacteria bacterium]MBT4542445.1 3-methyladenine DNA glycosylase [Alphaproteobacteria bacterium]MBT7745212.1 3-methyladenine DNA glycosylase [Alphaproteobacteria bacterium]
MDDFDSIFERAAARHGGAGAVEERLYKVKSTRQLKAIKDDRWLAEIAKRVFQAGFVWKIIEAKWPGFEEAFGQFDVQYLAHLSDDDIDNLLSDTRIVRNGQKIIAVRDNAIFLTKLQQEHGSVARFFAEWPSDDLIGLLEVMKKRGSRLGGMTGCYFLRFMGKESFILSRDVNAALIGMGVVDKAPTSKAALQKVQAAFNKWKEESGHNITHISQVLAMSADG